MRNVTKRTNSKGEISYLIRVSCGYDHNGKQIKKSMTYKPTPGMSDKAIAKEVERQAVLFEEKVKTGFVLDGNVKFADYAARFMEIKELSPKCRERYLSLLERINVSIGHIRLDKLQPMHLQEFYKDLRKIISKRTGQPLSDKTVLHHHRLISAILTHACREQLIPRNVADRAYMDAPKVLKKEPAYLDDKEAQEVIRLLLVEPDIRIKTAIILLIYTGVRRGELCGLEWKDINFTDNTVTICRAAQYVRNVGLVTKEPKNETSKRTFTLPPEVTTMLTQYRGWQLEERLKCGDRWLDRLDFKIVDGNGYKTVNRKNERIFTAKFGNLISPDTINFWLDKFRDSNNLPEFTPHSLRHTNVTLMIAAGVPIRTIAGRVGHAQASTTQNIYGHFIKSADEQAATALSDLLKPPDAKKA